jgi:hypothetical protein
VSINVWKSTWDRGTSFLSLTSTVFNNRRSKTLCSLRRDWTIHHGNLIHFIQSGNCSETVLKLFWNCPETFPIQYWNHPKTTLNHNRNCLTQNPTSLDEQVSHLWRIRYLDYECITKDSHYFVLVQW